MVTEADIGSDDEIGLFSGLSEINIVVVGKIYTATDIHQHRANFHIIALVEPLILVQTASSTFTRRRTAQGFLCAGTSAEKKDKKENKSVILSNLAQDFFYPIWKQRSHA